MNPVIRNIFWLLAEHGSRIILSTLSVSLMARALGVEQYGLLQYTLGLVAAFSSISFICGAEVLVPPLVTATPAERKRLLGNAFVLRQAASVVAYICLLIFAWVAEDRGNFYLIALIGSMMLWSESFIVTTVWLQAQTNIKPFNCFHPIQKQRKKSFSLRTSIFNRLLNFIYRNDAHLQNKNRRTFF